MTTLSSEGFIIAGCLFISGAAIIYFLIKGAMQTQEKIKEEMKNARKNKRNY